MQVAWTYNIKWTEGPCQHDARRRERKREGQRGMTGSLKHHSTVPFPTKCSNEVWKARALKRGTCAPGGEGKVRILGHVRRTHFLISRWYIRLKAERNGDVISETSSNMVPPPGTVYVGFLPTWPYLSPRDHTSPKVLLDPQDCSVPSPCSPTVVLLQSPRRVSCCYHYPPGTAPGYNLLEGRSRLFLSRLYQRQQSPQWSAQCQHFTLNCHNIVC